METNQKVAKAIASSGEGCTLRSDTAVLRGWDALWDECCADCLSVSDCARASGQ